MENEKKNYSETLNLPKTEFPMRGNLPEREPAVLEKQNEVKVYEKLLEKNKGNKIYNYNHSFDFNNIFNVWQLFKHQ